MITVKTLSGKEIDFFAAQLLADEGIWAQLH